MYVPHIYNIKLTYHIPALPAPSALPAALYECDNMKTQSDFEEKGVKLCVCVALNGQ